MKVSFDAHYHDLGYVAQTLVDLVLDTGDIDREQYNKYNNMLVELQKLMSDMSEKYGNGYVELPRGARVN